MPRFVKRLRPDGGNAGPGKLQRRKHRFKERAEADGSDGGQADRIQILRLVKAARLDRRDHIIHKLPAESLEIMLQQRFQNLAVRVGFN